MSLKKQFLFFCVFKLIFNRALCLSTEDLALALNFSTNGWVVLKNILPTLADDHIQLEIKLSYAKTRRMYVPYAVKYIKDNFHFDCLVDAPACGDFNSIEYRGENISLVDMEIQASSGFEYVKCCAELSGSKYVILRAALLDAHLSSLSYYQALNPHRVSGKIYEIATSPNLGELAALLLQEERVRLYQTAVFHKGKGALNMDTAWHQVTHMSKLCLRSQLSLLNCPLIATFERRIWQWFLWTQTTEDT